MVLVASTTTLAGETPQSPRRFLAIPYPFYNSTIGPGVGVAAMGEGYVQPRMLAVGSAIASAEGTYLLFGMVRNYQVPWFSRVILEPQGAFGEFQNIASYVDGNPEFPNERAGSNGSSKDNFIEADGTDRWVEVRIRYVLPLGDGRTQVLPRPALVDGVARTEAPRPWNPPSNGVTSLGLTPFYRTQALDDGADATSSTSGVEAELTHDNTDYRNNPSTGSVQKLFLSRDWGGFGSTSPWTAVGVDLTGYWSLGTSPTARQRVILLNAWAVDCLTWDAGHRPPTYKGANLGGLHRMRGYPATRYNDRAAIYYGAEYRHTLAWNPLQGVTLGERLDVDWFQLVGFGELGRVSPERRLRTLHSHMRWGAGVGLRAMVNHLVVRADFGITEEDAILQMFIGQPF